MQDQRVQINVPALVAKLRKTIKVRDRRIKELEEEIEILTAGIDTTEEEAVSEQVEEEIEEVVNVQ